MTEEKKGFKKTDIGLIPEDWEVVKVDSVISEISMGPFGSNIKVSNFVSKGIPVLTGKNVSSERLIDDFDRFVTPKKAKSLNKAVASQGDIVVTHRGTIGQISYIPDNSEFEEYVISQSQFRVRFKDHLVIPEWPVLYFLSERGSKKLLEGKGHTGVPAIAQATTTFRNLSIPLPTLAEQQTIASALSDMDELIRSIDGLIQKKQSIKKGTMQQLLTGKKRLPGFDGKWEMKQLGDVCQIISGGTPSTRNSEYWDGDIKWCTPTDITSNNGKYFSKTSRKITKQGLNNSSATLLPKGTLLLCSRATVGEVKIATIEISTNQGFKSLICSETVDNEFLYYLIRLEKQKFIDKAFGSTFLEISKKNTSEIEFDFPPIEEQKASAQILSDMDRELQTLRQKREKYVQIKQGMMQQLLTGRIRIYGMDG